MPDSQLNFEGKDKTQVAIERLKTYEPVDGYWLAFSGGKDSIVLYDLAVKSGVKFEAHYSLTTVDPPELVHFIKENYPSVIIDRPVKTMWELIAAYSRTIKRIANDGTFTRSSTGPRPKYGLISGRIKSHTASSTIKDGSG